MEFLLVGYAGKTKISHDERHANWAMMNRFHPSLKLTGNSPLT
jgi:hypothetical protein